MFRHLRQNMLEAVLWAAAVLIGFSLEAGARQADEEPFLADYPVLPLPGSEARTEKEMKPYAEILPPTEETIDMVPLPGGEFWMGSPEDEKNRKDDEGPRRRVKIDPFWMGKYEITWDVFEIWLLQCDHQLRIHNNIEPTQWDKAADEYQARTNPSYLYCDPTYGMGKSGYPAISMTQLSARIFCIWLTKKTGRYYRLPTEAEWEYACRAGTDTAFSFGDDPADLDDYAWYYDNSDDVYHKVGLKKPNPWGLYDMHGNAAEWVLDQYLPQYPAAESGRVLDNPLVCPTKLYPRVVRGGSWNDDPETLRSAARFGSDENWSAQDPLVPKGIWFHPDAPFVGLRVVRPLRIPSARELEQKWDKNEPSPDDE